MKASMLAKLDQLSERLDEVNALLAREDAVAKKTKVTQVLKALPGYGPAKVAALIEKLGIDENRRVGGLGEQQRAKLLAEIGG